MRKLLLAATMVVTTLAASGCATMSRAAFAQPRVDFKDVTINGLGLTGGSLDIVLGIHNPNEFQLDATRLEYTLLVGSDSVKFGEGALDSKFVVNERDSTTVRLPLSFTYAGIGEAGRQLIQTGTVDYTVRGNLVVTTLLGNYTVPYRQTGSFSTLGGRR
jgi:LEA14-like dessication related protein